MSDLISRAELFNRLSKTQEVDKTQIYMMLQEMPVKEQEEQKKKEIYSKARAIYGLHAQIDMVFEECAELQKELCKFKRGKPCMDGIAEEIADCEIMLEQMKYFFDMENDVDLIKKGKIERLNLRLSFADNA